MHIKDISRCLVIITMIASCACSRHMTVSQSSSDIVIFPPPPDSPRIQFLASISSSADVEGRQSGFNRFLFGPSEPVPVIKPYGISSHGSRIYICDTGLGGIIIIDLEKKSFVPFLPGGKGQLMLPLNCSVDDRGYLFVADGNRKQVVIYDESLNYAGAIGGGDNFKPTDVKADGHLVYITSLTEHLISIYSRDSLKLIKSFPDVTTDDPSYLYQPTNICIAGGKVYVSDMGDYRVKIFTADGEYLGSVGSYGNNYGQFTRPKGVAVDSTANIYVVDAAFENVQIFNGAGALLMFFGGHYSRHGDMWLPAGIALDYNNISYFSGLVDHDYDLKYLILVASQYGPDKIGVYGFIEAKKNR
jgi:hypothetical protein